MDGREDESGSQALQAKLLQGVEEGVEPRLGAWTMLYVQFAGRSVIRRPV